MCVYILYVLYVTIINLFIISGVPSIMVREFMSSFSIFKHHLENTKCPCGLEKVFPGRYMLNFIVQHYYDTETSRKAGDFVYNWEHFITSGSIKNGGTESKTYIWMYMLLIYISINVLMYCMYSLYVCMYVSYAINL